MKFLIIILFSGVLHTGFHCTLLLSHNLEVVVVVKPSVVTPLLGLARGSRTHFESRHVVVLLGLLHFINAATHIKLHFAGKHWHLWSDIFWLLGSGRSATWSLITLIFLGDLLLTLVVEVTQLWEFLLVDGSLFRSAK